MNEAGRGRLGRQISRRGFLAVAAGSLAACTADDEPIPASTNGDLQRTWKVPAEDAPHRRTWMAWPSSRAIWGNWLPGLQQDIALVANTIARYEPVVMCATRGHSAAQAQRLCAADVEVIDTIPVDDCWMRDTGPVFRHAPDGSLGALGLSFNGWGDKQTHAKDSQVAHLVADEASAQFEVADVVGEGGGIECDGDGTLMATESSWVNANRNPGLTKQQIEQELLAQFGATRMLWVPGIRGKDITDNHIDATSRFIKPGVVMVQVPPRWRDDIWAKDARQQLRILSEAKDARGRRLRVIEMAGPREVRPAAQGIPGLLRQLCVGQRGGHHCAVR